MKEEVSNDREEGQIYLEVSRYVNRKGRGPQEPSQEWVHKHGGRLKANKGTYQNKTSREKENRGGEPHRGHEAAQETRARWANKPAGGRTKSENENPQNKEKEDLDPPGNQESKDPEKHSEGEEEHAHPEDMFAWVAV
jgi:hypothetical protein